MPTSTTTPVRKRTPAEMKAARKEANASITKLGKAARTKFIAWSGLVRKSAIAYYEMGLALKEAKEVVLASKKLTGVSFGDWCIKNEISESTAIQAIKITERLTLEQAEGCYGPTEMKEKAGIVSVKDHTRQAAGSSDAEITEKLVQFKVFVGENRAKLRPLAKLSLEINRIRDLEPKLTEAEFDAFSHIAATLQDELVYLRKLLEPKGYGQPKAEVKVEKAK